MHTCRVIIIDGRHGISSHSSWVVTNRKSRLRAARRYRLETTGSFATCNHIGKSIKERVTESRIGQISQFSGTPWPVYDHRTAGCSLGTEEERAVYQSLACAGRWASDHDEQMAVSSLLCVHVCVRKRARESCSSIKHHVHHTGFSLQ